MHNERTSFDLLAHFDHPKTCDLQSVSLSSSHDRGKELADDDICLRIEERSDDSAPSCHTSKRGIKWVLKWAIAIAILTVAASMLTEFAYVLAAEHRLNMAARAAISEAILPRATVDTVRAVVERRLAKAGLVHHLQLTILQNGQPVQQQIRQSEGDRFDISLSLPSSDLIPKWVRILDPSRRECLLFAHAECQVPGRKLAYRRGTQTAAE
jgi:hypothetical protein